MKLGAAASLAVVGAGLAVLAACGGDRGPPLEGPPPPAAPKPPLPPGFDPDALTRRDPPKPPAPEGPCPSNMAFVDTSYCDKPKQRCLKDEYDKANHITICHAFAPERSCSGAERRERFCIDKYEYPNQEGAHPPVMVSWYDAAALCGEQQKRLCWESEWVAACEGPDKLPFPYGLRRDPAACNIDNPYIKPDLAKMYAADPRVSGPELLKLDESVRSGARAGCVSGFGVHDLTGNVDEWVNAEQMHEKSRWAGLKGGAWGHVRNACRPMTVSHPPEFTYYFISFRCCKDAAADAEASADPKLWRPPPPLAPDKPHPHGAPFRGWPGVAAPAK